MIDPPSPAESPLQQAWRRLRTYVRQGDTWLFTRVNTMPHPPLLNTFMRILATVMNRGDGWLLGVLVLTVTDQFRGRSRGRKILWRVAPVLWLATATVEFPLKSLFRRPRPFAQIAKAVLVGAPPRRHSFPSGHSAAAFAGAWLLSEHFPRLQSPFYALASLVAFCRVYLGVHYPTDVVAGALSGVGLAALYRKLWRRGRR